MSFVTWPCVDFVLPMSQSVVSTVCLRKVFWFSIGKLQYRFVWSHMLFLATKIVVAWYMLSFWSCRPGNQKWNKKKWIKLQANVPEIDFVSWFWGTSYGEIKQGKQMKLPLLLHIICWISHYNVWHILFFRDGLLLNHWLKTEIENLAVVRMLIYISCNYYPRYTYTSCLCKPRIKVIPV